MSDPLANPIWSSITGIHRAMAIGDNELKRYPSAVGPFMAVPDFSRPLTRPLAPLMEEGEEVVFVGDFDSSQLSDTTVVHISWADQMIYEGPPVSIDVTSQITQLGTKHVPAMLALMEKVFPGYFRKETWRMGDYFGIFDGPTLVAMAGERLRIGTYQEISAICTLPEYRGRGYASLLTTHVMAQAQKEGLTPILHVDDDNERAIAVYKKLGFKKSASLKVTRLARKE